MNFNEAFLIVGTIIDNATASENHVPNVVSKKRASKGPAPRFDAFRSIAEDDFWTLGYDHEASFNDRQVIDSYVARHMH